VGLWDEPWADFFGNLARAVQPYAHYSPQLLGWQMAFHGYGGGNRFLVKVGPAAYDALKASRIALLHALVIWTLARLLLQNSQLPDVSDLAAAVSALGNALASSKLLFKSKNWADELAPHVLFKPGHDWQDD
jgi:hypothetical protein